MKNNNKGFTLMELIIVVAIIATLLGISALGVSSYLETADKNERESVAKNTYLALQEHLTAIKKSGELKDFNKSLNNSGYAKKLNIDGSELQSILENHYDDNYASYYNVFKENHEDCDIAAIVYTGPDKEHPLYDILFNCLGDEDILKHAFVIEYNQTTGVMMSVFYSKSIDAFSLSNMYNANYTAMNNIVSRDSASIENKKQGYYGVYNTANKGKELPTVNDQDIEAKIVNEDRLYLNFKDTTAYMADIDDTKISYVVDLYVKGGSGTPFAFYTFDRKNVEAFTDSNSTMKVLDSIDEVVGMRSGVKAAYKKTYDNLGNNTDYFLVLLDCIHENAFVNEYADEIKSLEGIDEPGKCEIYANVSVLYNGSVIASSVSNETNPLFNRYDSASDIFYLSCTRHLNNIRNMPSDSKYVLSADINLKQFEKEESNKEDETLDETDITNRHWYSEFEPIVFKDFAGNTVNNFTGSLFGYKDSSYDLNTITEDDCYKIKGLTIKKEADNVGLFNAVKSDDMSIRIGALSFKDSLIEGKKNVGILCGESNSPISSVFINNSDVTGLCYVGGICGSLYKNLTGIVATGELNVRSSDKTSLVEVAKEDKILTCVGGLVGYSSGVIDNAKVDCSEGIINHFEDDEKIYGNAIGGIAGVCEGSIRNCEVNVKTIDGFNNAGAVVGISYADILGCEVLFDTINTAGYSGGICGTAYSHLTISDCNASGGSIHMYYYDSESKHCGGIVATVANTTNMTTTVKPKDLTIGSLEIKNCVNDVDIIIEDIKNSKFESSKPSVGFIGGITGGNQNDDTYSGTYYNMPIEISNCTNNGEILCNKAAYGQINYIGGVAGLIGKKTTVLGCSNNGDITADVAMTNVAGILGSINEYSGEVTVSKCENTGKITSKRSMTYTAGIVGYSWPSLYVFNCINKENSVIGCDGFCNKVAGIVGASKKSVAVSGCENDANLDLIREKCVLEETDTIGDIGGIIGEIELESLNQTIDSCINKGNINIGVIENAYIDYVGGIIGGNHSAFGYGFFSTESNVFTNLKNYGSITVLSEAGSVGGFAGHIESSYRLGKADNNKSGFINDEKAVLKGYGMCEYWGGIVGISYNPGEIYFSENNAPINLMEGDFIGGIIGIGFGNKIVASQNNGAITLTGNGKCIGGLVGAEREKEVCLGVPGNSDLACKSNANISVVNGSATYIGGLIGDVSCVASLYNTTFDGTIYADINVAGGAIGRINNDTAEVLFDSCVINGELVANRYAGDTTARMYVGGLIGECTAKMLTLKDVEVNNPITINYKCDYVGGFIGRSAGGVTFEGQTLRSGDITIDNLSEGDVKYISSLLGISKKEMTISGVEINDNILITGNATYVGGVTGTSGESQHVDGVNISGNITIEGKAKHSGGMFGYAPNFVEIYNVVYDGDISIGDGSAYIGGLVGYQDTDENGINIDSIEYRSDINCSGGLTYSGGLIGYSKYQAYVSTAIIQTNIVTEFDSEKLGGVIGNAASLIDIFDTQYVGNININGSAKEVSLLAGAVTEGACIWDTVVEGDVSIGTDAQYVGAFGGKINSNIDAGNDTYTGNININKTANNVSAYVGYLAEESYVYNITVESNINIESDADSIGLFAGTCAGGIILTGEDYGEGGGERITGDININGNGKNIGGVIGYSKGTAVANDESNSTELKYEGNIYVQNGNCVGGAIGYAGQAKLYNMNISGDITVGNSGEKIGGILGSSNNNQTFSGIKRQGNIILQGGDNVYISGGIAFSKYSSTAKNIDVVGSVKCQNNASVSKAGGLFGYITSVSGYNTKITDCSFKGNINGITSGGGGLIGYCDGNKITITDSVAGSSEKENKLTVKGNQCGGLVGCQVNAESNFEIKGCTNYLDIICTSDSSDSIGGIVGAVNKKDGASVTAKIYYSDTNKYTMNYGNITSNGLLTNAGGIIGTCNDKINVYRCQNLGDIDGNRMEYVGSIGGNCKMPRGYSESYSSKNSLGVFALYSSSNIKAASNGSNYVGGMFGKLIGSEDGYPCAFFNAYYTGSLEIPSPYTNVGQICGYREVRYTDVYSLQSIYTGTSSGKYATWQSAIGNGNKWITDEVINKLNLQFNVNNTGMNRYENLMLLIDNWKILDKYTSALNEDLDSVFTEDEDSDELISVPETIILIDEESVSGDSSEDDISDNDISDNDASDDDLSGDDTSENDVSGNETRENDISENDASDKETSENDISDNDVIGNEASGNDVSGNDASDKETSENDINEKAIFGKKTISDIT